MGMHVGGGLGPMSGNGSGGGHNRSKMHELAKNEHLDWAIVRRALFALTPYRLQAVFVSLLLLAIAAHTPPIENKPMRKVNTIRNVSFVISKNKNEQKSVAIPEITMTHLRPIKSET